MHRRRRYYFDFEEEKCTDELTDIWTHFVKLNLFRIVKKKIWKKGLTLTSRSTCARGVSRKSNSFFGLCEKDNKKMCHGTLFRSIEISLFCGGKTEGGFFFTKLCATHTCCEDVCVKFSFEFFDILKCDGYEFFESGFICPWAQHVHTLEDA